MHPAGPIERPDSARVVARAALENGWSRAVLDHQIDSGLFDRQGEV
ncbi:hypothetical protein [Deinococcus misasensis]|nr:hypothetical protein [Deinococcus misasensis]